MAPKGGALVERFRAHLARRKLLPRPGVAIVAVSGGPDSVALLDLLVAVAKDAGLTLVVAHADHGIRADSRIVGLAVSALAERYELPFELGQLRLGSDATETEARHARYEFLRAVKHKHQARYIVTAHHRDDQVETLLLRFFRGSAPAGLAGIPARGRGGLIRPLLPFTRAELAAHVKGTGLASHDDPANRDPRHLRSWLRTTLVPQLVERLGPRLTGDLVRAGRFAARERRAWNAVLQLLPESELHVDARGFDVAREVLARYDNALSVALLRAAARRAGLPLGPVRARRLLHFAAGRSGRSIPLGGGGGWTATLEFDRLRVSREKSEESVATVQAAGKGKGRLAFGRYEIAWKPERAPAHLERSGWTTWVPAADWEVRAPHKGDRLVPLGGVGNRPLRRLLMEARVPRGRRGGYPVVARGETILWVPGICRSDALLPAPGTRAVRLDVIGYGEP